ncbi:MAG: NapC/NirT family cytochrome c [Thermoanaerobaculia bacterium]
MAEKQTNGSLIRNPISLIGLLIALVSLANILFLVYVEVSGIESKPYIGVLAYMVMPGVMGFGLVVVLAGMLWERRRRHHLAPGEVTRFPRLDLNDPRTRRNVFLSVAGAAIFIFISTMGSYQAYEYTDSVKFCGQLCHGVMNPEYTAYLQSPHARVACVECHVGPGAGWYVRSKLSGAYQVYATVLNKFPRPIPTPVENLRPAQQTCEQCHWPEKFWGAQLKVFNHFGYDEQNTPREVQLLIKTGGGSPTGGLTAGIHWHMNIANEITYVATDAQRQTIPWVQLRDRKTGKTVVYVAKDSEVKPEQLAQMPKRVMDCIDCHNRPTHIYVPPDQSVDRAMLAGRIAPDLPFIKQQVVDALSASYNTTPEAVQSIAKKMNDYYQTTYPQIYGSKKAEIDRAVATTQDIFQKTIFPEMKVDWKVHPNNVGHLYYKGCFRCHDDQHVSSDGKVITKACNSCHTVLEQREKDVLMVQEPSKPFEHPVDLGDLTDYVCADCHTGGGSPG